MSNPMKAIRIAKITLNIGTGKDEDRLKKAMKLLEKITNAKVVKTFTTKRIPNWGVRPGLPLGCKTTLRGKKAEELLPKLLEARANTLPPSCFDDFGNVSFGIEEYINIPGLKYDPSIGMLGLEVSITLERPGFRIKRRKIRPKKIPNSHKINKQDAMDFMASKYGVKVGEPE
ncbi:50S ribosomal protein L5 [Candidatus Woesearchaeota archaeon]|nr:50S ribosomal protein L5 [Candidatus Woesearchaeota archaeon]